MRNLELFTLASQEFFDSLSRLPRDPLYRNLVQNLLPPDWTIKSFDIWLLAHPPDYPWIAQGFKIHVSATRTNAQRLLEVVIPECVASNLAFKFAADSTLLSLMNCKNFDRGSSGKFLVIYPLTIELFKETLARLHSLTADEEGPYILSDRRYPSSKVVHYRYGGFRHMTKISLGGTSIACIQTPEGRLEPDRRLPYFQLPPWVADPLPEDPASDPQTREHLLHEHYRIETALTFSNTGGVYLAVDTRTSNKVILKEARPFTHFIPFETGMDYLDGVRLLAREHAILQRLQDCPRVVRCLDFFQEWEHFFLVEEFIDAVPLTNYRAREDFVVITLTKDASRVDQFCEKFRSLARHLIALMSDVHSRGILLGDVSPNNFLVDPETLEVTLIDVETAVICGAQRSSDKALRTWTTAGFRKRVGRTSEPLSPVDDFFALGMVLYSLVLPIQSFFEIDPRAKDRFIDDIVQSLGIPGEVKQTIFLLLDNRVEDAVTLLNDWHPRRLSRAVASGASRNPWERWNQSHREQIAARIDEVLPRIAAYLLTSFDAQRQDRLWPADVTVFNTNPLSLAAGACGPLLFLADTGHSVPSAVQEWLQGQQLAIDTYPPGLYWGLAGVAFTFAELGFEGDARAALDLANHSPLRFEGADMFHGAAGWGWANLWFYERTREKAFLAQARAAGEHLWGSAEIDAGGRCWRNPLDGLIHYGFGYGASGISLFLLQLYQVTNDPRYLELARLGLEFELNRAIDPSDAALKWRNNEHANLIAEPYWVHGSAGIGSVFIRFASALDDEHYLEIATRAAEFAFSKYAVEPSQFSGLSGIGELMLDMFRYSNQEIYLNRAYAVADSILMYAVERSQGVAFPGRLLLRLSCDFGTGSAGIGLFLHRLLRLEGRRFFDLEMAIASAAETIETPPSRLTLVG